MTNTTTIISDTSSGITPIYASSIPFVPPLGSYAVASPSNRQQRRAQEAMQRKKSKAEHRQPQVSAVHSLVPRHQRYARHRSVSPTPPALLDNATNTVIQGVQTLYNSAAAWLSTFFSAQTVASSSDCDVITTPLDSQQIEESCVTLTNTTATNSSIMTTKKSYSGSDAPLTTQNASLTHCLLTSKTSGDAILFNQTHLEDSQVLAKAGGITISGSNITNVNMTSHDYPIKLDRTALYRANFSSSNQLIMSAVQARNSVFTLFQELKSDDSHVTITNSTLQDSSVGVKQTFARLIEVTLNQIIARNTTFFGGFYNIQNSLFPTPVEIYNGQIGAAAGNIFSTVLLSSKSDYFTVLGARASYWSEKTHQVSCDPTHQFLEQQPAKYTKFVGIILAANGSHCIQINPEIEADIDVLRNYFGGELDVSDVIFNPKIRIETQNIDLLITLSISFGVLVLLLIVCPIAIAYGCSTWAKYQEKTQPTEDSTLLATSSPATESCFNTVARKLYTLFENSASQSQQGDVQHQELSSINLDNSP